MRLPEVLSRRDLVILGINSGTSADGVDLAAVRIRRRQAAIRCFFLSGTRRSYPDRLREQIRNIALDCGVGVEQVMAVDTALGLHLGKVARSYIQKLEGDGIAVHAVASHGQTVRHLPGAFRIGRSAFGGSLQIGSAEHIASNSGRIVVADFRQADIAIGGEGAPITTAAMARLFGDKKHTRLIANIGGIANYFAIPAGSGWSGIRAADCGPGNVLCDELARRLFSKKYDSGGRLALQGQVARKLLDSARRRIRADRRARLSLSREEFASAFADWLYKQGKRMKLGSYDIMATAAQITVDGIADCIESFVTRRGAFDKLYLTGGGARNRFFIYGLRDRFSELEIVRIDSLGIPGGLVEASSFAVLGEAALRSEPLPTRFDGRARGTRPISGRIIQPPDREQT
jgi:anhydro-N-acetylmuramic acid kinase